MISFSKRQIYVDEKSSWVRKTMAIADAQDAVARVATKTSPLVGHDLLLLSNDEPSAALLTLAPAYRPPIGFVSHQLLQFADHRRAPMLLKRGTKQTIGSAGVILV